MSDHRPIGTFRCPRCGITSHNPNDMCERYCGRCHVFVDDNPPPETVHLTPAQQRALDRARRKSLRITD